MSINKSKGQRAVAGPWAGFIWSKPGAIAGTSQDAAVTKNPSANAEDTGVIPGPGGFHMPRSNEARGSQLRSPRALEPVLYDKRSRLQREAQAPQGRIAPAHCN